MDETGTGGPQPLPQPSSDPDQDFDTNYFTNHPVTSHGAIKLRSLGQEWEQMGSLVEGSAFALLNDIVAAVSETTDETDPKELQTLDGHMKDLIDMREALRHNQRALEELHQEIQQKDIVNIMDVHEQAVNGEAEPWAKKTARQRYAKSEAYRRFRIASYEVLHPESGVPPLDQLIPVEDGDDDDDDDDDDDLQVSGIVQELRCPISLTLMVDPYTSDVCHHSYSKAPIWDLLGENTSAHSKKPCPACNTMICKDDLHPNKDLEVKIERRRRRLQREEDIDEVENTID
ncbi:unnamed protein product [Peniophora sp. CBMAI 1063]|nr:unnamed protein product [Peniophora sp. CBMAI 1063]